MCYKVECGTCAKSSWAGCGRHVASVYQQIPEGQHCQCKNWPGVPAAASAKVGSSAEVDGSGGAAGTGAGAGAGAGSETSTCAIL